MKDLILTLSNIIVLVSLLAAFLTLLKSRQNKSYLHLFGYFCAISIIMHNLATTRTFIPFGLWVFPLVLLSIGEITRHKKYERKMAEKVRQFARRKGLHLDYAYFYSMNKEAPQFVDLSKTILATRTSGNANELGVLLDFYADGPIAMTPEDFDVAISPLEGTCKISYKSTETTLYRPTDKFSATSLTPFTIHASKGSRISLLIVRRPC